MNAFTTTGLTFGTTTTTDAATIGNLLRDLRGNPFTTSITVPGIQFVGQKVVSFEGNVVFTVDTAGLVRATQIPSIVSVDF